MSGEAMGGGERWRLNPGFSRGFLLQWEEAQLGNTLPCDGPSFPHDCQDTGPEKVESTHQAVGSSLMPWVMQEHTKPPKTAELPSGVQRPSPEEAT